MMAVHTRVLSLLSVACLFDSVPGVGANKWLIEYNSCDG